MDGVFSPLKRKRVWVVACMAFFCIICLAGSHGQAFQPPEAPEISKVEPPNWWVGHSINPVRLLLRGKHLSGARVEASGTGLQTGLARGNEAGAYILVPVLITAGAGAGSI